MGAINIHGGSDKQNAWASDIAGKWLATITEEIERTVDRVNRGESSMQKYVDCLNVAKSKFVEVSASWKARDVIDRKGNNYGQFMVEQARKLYAQEG